MHVTLKKGHTVLLATGQPFKAQSVNKDAVETDPLYRWSELRSEYEAQANIQMAQTIVVNGGWYGLGWYWIPFWNCYGFLPGDGICLARSAGDSIRLARVESAAPDLRPQSGGRVAWLEAGLGGIRQSYASLQRLRRCSHGRRRFQRWRRWRLSRRRRRWRRSSLTGLPIKTSRQGVTR